MSKTNNVITFPRNEQPTAQDVLKMLVRVRYVLLGQHQQAEQLRVSKNHLRRAVAIWEGRPFMAARIEQAQADIATLDEPLGRMRAFRRDVAGFLPELCRAADDLLTLEQKLDVLNVNAADRVGLEPDARMMDLIFRHALEDSAARRGQDFNDAPLFNVALLVFRDFLTKTPEGKAFGDAQFEPGGMFERLPTYKRQPSGSMTRNPPRLRVVH